MGDNISSGHRNGFGIAGFIFGLLGVALFFMPYFAVASSLLGFIFSLVQINKNKTKLSVAGLVLSTLGFIIAIVSLVMIYQSVSPGIVKDPYLNDQGRYDMIEGTVYDTDGNIVIGASVDASCLLENYSWGIHLETSENGGFAMMLPPSENITLCDITVTSHRKRASLEVDWKEYDSPLSITIEDPFP